jgi:mRNA interferase MazF
MKVFQKGQLWLVNFEPSFGHEYQKIRPAIIIQHNDTINFGNLLTIVPISSQLTTITELDILIKATSNNRLMKDSLIKTKHISSFDKRRFIKLIGICEQNTQNFIDKNIQKFLFG